MENKFNIAFCLNDAYAPYVAVTIKSIVENNDASKVIIHILTDGISEQHINMLHEIIPATQLHIHLVDDGKLRKLKDTWSIYAWYRILLPEILIGIENVLYLDTDIIVDGCLSPLFELNMSGKSVAGVIDVQSFNGNTYTRCEYESSKQYICAGVLMMNLEYWRQHSLSECIIAWALDHNNKIHFPDQDAINHICCDTKIILDLQYGVLDAFFHDKIFYENPYKNQLLKALEHPVIIHYAGQSPWIIERTYHQFQSRWDYYNQLIPKPNSKKHFPSGLRLIYYNIRILLNKLGVLSFKLWHVSANITDEEIRQQLLDSK